MSERHCETCECEIEPTPEEIAAVRERKLALLEARMIPARSAYEQTSRDANEARNRSMRMLNEAMYRTYPSTIGEFMPRPVGVLGGNPQPDRATIHNQEGVNNGEKD